MNKSKSIRKILGVILVKYTLSILTSQHVLNERALTDVHIVVNNVDILENLKVT